VTRRRFLIEGEVQGVGYRRFVQRAALRLGVAGWVRNLDDGRVEVEAAGPDPAVAEMAACLEKGPPGANVTKVDSSEILDQTKGVSGFRITH
jgi:acylphosphatase